MFTYHVISGEGTFSQSYISGGYANPLFKQQLNAILFVKGLIVILFKPSFSNSSHLELI